MPLVAAVVLVLLASTGVAEAHPKEGAAGRELVRIQGHRREAGSATGVTSMTLAALGIEYPFIATDVRVFGFGESPAMEGAVGARATLQGGRDVLRRFTTARPDQRVTILAERRGGSSDLFVLAIDLCPDATDR